MQHAGRGYGVAVGTLDQCQSIGQRDGIVFYELRDGGVAADRTLKALVDQCGELSFSGLWLEIQVIEKVLKCGLSLQKPEKISASWVSSCRKALTSS